MMTLFSLHSLGNRCRVGRRALGRAGAAGTAAVAALVLSASPAAAHSAGATGPTNFRTEITGVRPAVPGVSVRVLGLGTRLELTNRSGADVVVLGYEGEPYLRIGPQGVYENARSPATYLNKDRRGRTPVPADARADAPPRWQKVSDGRTARWHDHRVHWMGGGTPPAVRADAGRTHVLSRWEVPMRVGGREMAVLGRLEWVPGPRQWPWWLGAAGLAIVAGVAARRRLALAVAAVALAVVDALHVGGMAWAPGEVGSPLARFVVAGIVPALGWAAALAGARLLQRRRLDQGAALVAVGGFVALVLGGLGDMAALGRSQVPFAGGATAARAAVAATLGLGAAVTARGAWLAWAASGRAATAAVVARRRPQ